MAEISKINANNTTYDIKDSTSRAALDWTVNQGVKNLINLNPNTYTMGNVVVKLNDDGTVSVSLSSGSTANTTFSRAIKTITDLRDMDLILNGCPSGGNYSSGYALYISDDSTTKEKDEGNGVLVPKSTTVTTSYLALIVRSGTAISGTLTFKPMIRHASITDPTFQPYALPNPTLTPAVIKAVDEGAKNALNFDAVSRASHNGVDFTYNADGSVTVNAASSTSDNAYCYLNLDGSNVNVKALCDGNHVISGCPTNSSGVTLRIMGTGYTTVTDSGNGATITAYSGENVIRVAVYVAKNGTPSNIKVKPMICTAADWVVSHKYVPYAPTNRELYEMILALQNNS